MTITEILAAVSALVTANPILTAAIAAGVVFSAFGLFATKAKKIGR